MITFYVLDVPENRGLVDVARADAAITVRMRGPYFEIRAQTPIAIDRRASGCRHAVWYSSIAGLANTQIVQWDKTALRFDQL